MTSFSPLLLVLALGCSSHAASPSSPPPPSTTRPPAPASPPPVTDADGDGIADVDDLCPDQPETRNELDDDDGCPDKNCVAMPRVVTCMVEPIYFAKGSATIATEHDGALDAMITDLAKHPNITRVVMQGFASRDEPKRLAIARAQAVVDRLVARGVAADKLHASAGAPSTKPSEPIDATRRVDAVPETRPIENGGSSECTAFGAIEITTPTVCK